MVSVSLLPERDHLSRALAFRERPDGHFLWRAAPSGPQAFLELLV